jgi:hypothetical protein
LERMKPSPIYSFVVQFLLLKCTCLISWKSGWTRTARSTVSRVSTCIELDLDEMRSHLPTSIYHSSTCMSRGIFIGLSTFRILISGRIKALLRASLNHNGLMVEKFARWLRAICTIILARNTATDRTKAIGYVEQALAVIEDHNDSDEV